MDMKNGKYDQKKKKKRHFTASVQKQQHFLRQDLDIFHLQFLHDHVVAGCWVTQTGHRHADKTIKALQNSFKAQQSRAPHCNGLRPSLTLSVTLVLFQL